MVAETSPEDDDELALAIFTGEQAPDLSDDRARIAEWFADRGHRVEAVRWDRPADWSDYDCALFRSCYEYPAAPARFRAVLEAMERGDVTACNPVAAVCWNVHKSYVTDLATAGVPVPETAVVQQGAPTTLAAEIDGLGLEQAVVKPAVGTGSDGFFRVAVEDADRYEDRFATLLEGGDVLVQAYAPDIAQGERSIAFVGGEYSHAWNSPTTAGDVTRFEGNDHGYESAEAVIEAAADTCRAARDVLDRERPFPYARVDYVRDGKGIVVLELELVEPILHLERHGAVERFCEAVQAHFEGSGSGERS